MYFGIDPLKVVEYTPYEITLIAKQQRENETRQFERDLTLAWHTEAFSRQKKLPRLERILKDVRRQPKRKNSASDAILKAMAAEKGVIIK